MQSGLAKLFGKLCIWGISKVCLMAEPKIGTMLHAVLTFGVQFSNLQHEGLSPPHSPPFPPALKLWDAMISSCDPLAAQECLVFH